MELTEVQTNAVETTERNVVVSAGAGTGKTAVLVERFINLVRRGLAQVNQILTITFTEKAAQEMKQRIAEGFQRLGMRREKAAVETSYISTIHSFCSRLIKENPFAAGVDPEFEVMDEIDRQLIFGELFDRLFSEGEDDFLELAEHYGENAISRAIITYMDLCRSLGRDVQYVAKLLARPELLTYKAEALAEKRAARAMLEIRECVHTLSRLRASTSCEDKRRAIVALTDSLSDVRSFRNAAEEMSAITARMPVVPKKGNSRAACLQVRQELSRIVRILKDHNAEIFFDKQAEEMLLPSKIALLKGVALFWRSYQQTKSERGVLDYEDLQLIARGLLRDNPTLRRDYAGRFRYVLVDEFQDINWLQKELIELLTSGNNLFVVGDSCQSIYGFRNADVEIFAGLVQNCPSSPATHRSIFLSENFRSGQNLIHFFNFFFSRLWQTESPPAYPPTPPAHRSQPGEHRRGSPHPRPTIFHPLRYARKGGQEPAAPSVEIILATPDGPHSQHAHVPGTSAASEKRDAPPASGSQDAPQLRQREARCVAARLLTAVRDADTLAYDPALGRSRPLTYGDIAVLCRTRATYSAYAEAFAELGLPFLMVGGQSFYDKQEVADLINLLTIIDNPLRDIPLVAVLRSPFVGVSDETLLLLSAVSRSPTGPSRLRSLHSPPHDSRRNNPQTQAVASQQHPHHAKHPASEAATPAPADRPGLRDGPSRGHILSSLRQTPSISAISDDDKRKLLEFLELLDALRSRKDSIPLHLLVKLALDSTPYMTRILASPAGTQKAANVSKFLNLLRDYDARQAAGIGAFLRFYEVMRYYGPREEEAPLQPFSGNIVKLMTIHAAKGLEFPVVIVADMSRRFNFDRDRFLFSRDMDIGCAPWQESSGACSGRNLLFQERKENQLAEEKRLLYVAMTRARDHLILAGSYRPEKQCQTEKANSPVDWLMAVLPDQPELPQAGRSRDLRLGDASVRIFVNAPQENPDSTPPGTSLLQRYSDRIAAGQNIPLADASGQKLLPQVKKLLAAITSARALQPATPPAEISVSQLMQFEECPYKFFLRHMLKFPDSEVMTALQLSPAIESQTQQAQLELPDQFPIRLPKREFGELVHACLEHIDFRAAQHRDLSSITTRFFSSAEDAQAAERLIRRFLRTPHAMRLRDAVEVHRELPVKAAVADTIITGVVDLLYLDKHSRWTILDFKTGATEPDDPSPSSLYDFQMLLYAFLVSQATGAPPEKAVLHFLRSGTSRIVSTTSQNIERTQKRVAEIIAAIAKREFKTARRSNCRPCVYAAACAPDIADAESPRARRPPGRQN